MDAARRAQADGARGGALTCSNSSVMVLGSSCLWNHIMYLVWNRQDCFFRALAARYWAFVPCGAEAGAQGLRLGQGGRLSPGPATDQAGPGHRAHRRGSEGKGGREWEAFPETP